MIPADEDLADSRLRPRETGARWRLDDVRAASAALDWWSKCLLECIRVGVAGFRLLSVDTPNPAWWKALCARAHAFAPDTRMLAWTQGMKSQTVAMLAGAGFDHTFCFAEWWDFRAGWLGAEYRRLAVVAPPLACAGAPASGGARDAGTAQAHRRAMWFAATLGVGWLMPVGFEQGAAAQTLGDPDQPANTAQPANQAAAGFDLVADVTPANAWLAADRVVATMLPILHLAVGWSGILRIRADAAQVLLVNADLQRHVTANRAALLAPASTPARGLHTSVQRIAAAGAATSLPQAVLKLTTPGVRDIYRGTEFWDFSLVDPDNRRPVDFAARQRALDVDASVADLLGHWRDGHLKQYVIRRLLDLRARRSALFAHGDYRVLHAENPRGPNAAPEPLLAFQRGAESARVIVLALGHSGSQLLDAPAPRVDRHWLIQMAGSEDVLVGVPAGHYRDVLAGTKASVDGIVPAQWLRDLRVAVLECVVHRQPRATTARHGGALSQ